MDELDPRDPFEELVAKGLHAADSGDLTALERLCDEHPEEADRLRERVQSLCEMGLLRGPNEADGGVRDFPERLGEFRLLRRLASGGMGVVYIAEQERLGRKVALKLIHPEHLFFPGSRERFRREVEAVARLQHPGIVPIFTVGEDQGVPYFAMQRIRGCTLAEVLASLKDRDATRLTGKDLEGVLRSHVDDDEEETSSSGDRSLFSGSWTEVCVLLAQQVAEALQHAHERGVLHRDVKPSNIAITVEGRAMLLDFGLAWSEGETHMTRTGAWVGSLPYMSPEQIRGEHAAHDQRSDIYSLGVTLYEALTLRPPHQDENVDVTRKRILEGKPVALRRLNRTVSWEMETVCMTAMDPDPQRRYRQAGDLAHDLANVLSHRAIRARRPGYLLRLHRWTQRHPAATLGLGLVLIMAPTLLWLGQRATVLELQVRLLDALRIDRLQADAEELWPATPARLPAMDAWLARAREILDNMEVHARDLRALTGGVAVKAGSDRIQHQLEQLRGQRHEAIAARTAKWKQLFVADLDRRLEELSRRQRELTLRSAGQTDQLRFETLSRLVRARAGLERLVAEVVQRHRFASRLHGLTIEAYRDNWARTIRAIEEHPRYGGLVIRPQLGLIPLGQDPDSGLFEFAHLPSGEPVRRGADGHLRLTDEMGVVLVLLPGGTFQMGQESDEILALAGHGGETLLVEPDEAPSNRVRLEPFFISKFETTQAQWEHITGRRPSAYAPGWMEGVGTPELEISARHPVESVTWYECERTLARLGLGLPTEAQWEYAARAGTESVWWLGNARSDFGAQPVEQGAPLRSFVNVADHRCRTFGGIAPIGFASFEDWLTDGWATHAPVGSFPANPFGLHEIIGNVGEWCQDRLGDYSEPPSGPEGRFTKFLKPGRCYRGGSFLRPLAYCRSADRNQEWPGARSEEIGVRPARRIDP